MRTSPEPPEMTLRNAVGSAGWRLYACGDVESTNDIARGLPPWAAVRAATQSGGRGRFGRAFVSDRGGLWISAVLPATEGPQVWAGFSLMAGCHLVRMLEALRVREARLRWPNDLMAGSKKLGGLLIEQSAPGLLIVGFGLNVVNRPWEGDPGLAEIATSLACEAEGVPGLEEVTVRTLDALAEAHHAMLHGGMDAAIREFNDRWRRPIPVRILLSGGGSTGGRFAGLDPRGNLRLLDESGNQTVVAHHRVERLMETA